MEGYRKNLRPLFFHKDNCFYRVYGREFTIVKTKHSNVFEKITIQKYISTVKYINNTINGSEKITKREFEARLNKAIKDLK